MNDTPHISVVIPVYECSQFLNDLYTRLKNALEEITGDFEIILVNDASPGNDWDIIQELSTQDKRVKGINFSKNFGQHYAITAGLDHCSGTWVVVMDGDLQDQPEEIKKLYDLALKGYDIVLGRRNRRKDGFFKRIVSKLFYKLFGYLTETKQDEGIGNFGIYSRNVVNTICNMRENLRFFPTMVRWVGFKKAVVNIDHEKRKYGKSSYSYGKLLKLALNVIIAFSDKPLRLTVKLGFFISFFSFLYALFIVIRAFMGIRSIEGWPSLIVSIWFLSGLIIFILGFIGIYISRIFDETKKRPIYVVSEKVGFTD